MIDLNQGCEQRSSGLFSHYDNPSSAQSVYAEFEKEGCIPLLMLSLARLSCSTVEALQRELQKYDAQYRTPILFEEGQEMPAHTHSCPIDDSEGSWSNLVRAIER